jgi:DNA invertase Pin-like site-specific DNA recombinase
MIVGVYARKSTQQDVADDAKSVTRQIEHATAFAQSKGWIVDPAFIFSDDGISGAEFEKRPGLTRLLNSLTGRPFQVLVVSEISRLGREQFQTGYVLAQLAKAGIRIFTYLTGTEATLTDATSKFMLSVGTFADEMEREKARQRTSDAMVKKARQGFVTGGLVYGYRNVRRDSHVERVIDPVQAKIVRDIFARYIRGESPNQISKRLNRTDLQGGWRVTGVLKRPIYRGEVVSRWGTEVIRVQNEALRIVDDTTWHAAATRLLDVKRSYLRTTDGKLNGKPRSGAEAKYLLTGLLECECGATMSVRAWRKTKSYLCHAFLMGKWRRYSPCENSHPLKLQHADWAILQTIESTLLQPAVITRAIEAAIRRLDPLHRAERRRDLDAELTTLDREIGHLTRAIARGGKLESLLGELETRDARKAVLLADLARLAQADALASLNLATLEARLREKLQDWNGLLARHPQQTRSIITKLLIGRLRMTWTAEGYRFEGRGRITPLITGLIPDADTFLSWWPQRDSHALGSHFSPRLTVLVVGRTRPRDPSEARIRWFAEHIESPSSGNFSGACSSGVLFACKWLRAPDSAG